MVWSPASSMRQTRQSSHARLPGSSGLPVTDVVVSTPSKRSTTPGTSPANCSPSARWWMPRTLTPKARLRAMASSASSRVAAQTSTSGGRRLTLVKELAVKPKRSPSATAVTTVTPLANCARA